MALICACHRYGWPVARGRLAARSPTRSPRSSREHGGRIETGAPGALAGRAAGAPTRSSSTSRPARSPRSPATGCRRGSRAPTARYRHGPGAFKVDLAVEGGVPWADRGLRPGGHRPRDRLLRGDRRAPSARSTAAGCRSGRSSSSASSTWPTRRARAATSTRSGPTRTSPAATTGDATEAMHRPDRALRARPARADRRPTAPARPRELAAYNANYVGGDIITGANTPLPARCSGPGSRSTPTRPAIPGVYICSAATPPGAGAHGMYGFNAAASALRSLA